MQDLLVLHFSAFLCSFITFFVPVVNAGRLACIISSSIRDYCSISSRIVFAANAESFKRAVRGMKHSVSFESLEM